MSDAEADPQPVPDDRPEARATPTGPPRTVPVGAFVIAVLVAAALGILAVVALSTSGGDADDDLREARLAAGRFGERFLTFDHDELDRWKADVLSLSTGGFAEEVEEAEAALRRLVDETETDATAQVTDIFIGEIERGTVEVVLVYDREVRGASPRTETERYMQLTLIDVDGTWLVEDVVDIASASDRRGAALTPTTAVPTTAPPG